MGLERVIPDYPAYTISDCGEVRHNGRIVKPIKKSTGYYAVNLFNNGKSKMKSISRLVAMAFIPNPDNKPFVDHIDRDLANNNATNLRWVTQSENLLNKNTVRFRSAMIGDEKAVTVAIRNRVSRTTFYRRLANGWSVVAAATTKPKD